MSNLNQVQVKEHQFAFGNVILKGSIIGAMEAAINHPLWTIKTRIQSNKRMTFNPRSLYRGIGVNMLSMIPITAVQVTTVTTINNTSFMKVNEENPLMDKTKKISSAVFGGAVSALISTPAEFLMSQKYNFKSTIFTPKQLYIGGVATAMRDGIFTAGFLAAPAIIEEQIKERAFAGPIAGVIAAVISHPFDTIKTVQQAHINPTPLSFVAAAKNIVKDAGLFNLYKGFVPRSIRVVSAVTIMDQVGTKLKPYLG